MHDALKKWKKKKNRSWNSDFLMWHLFSNYNKYVFYTHKKNTVCYGYLTNKIFLQNIGQSLCGPPPNISKCHVSCQPSQHCLLYSIYSFFILQGKDSVALPRQLNKQAFIPGKVRYRLNAITEWRSKNTKKFYIHCWLLLLDWKKLT